MVERSAGRKTTPTRKKKQPSTPAPPIQQESAKAEIQQKIGDLPVHSHLEKGISELQGLYEVLVSGILANPALYNCRVAMQQIGSV